MPKQINPNLNSWASELDDNALEQALRLRARRSSPDRSA